MKSSMRLVLALALALLLASCISTPEPEPVALVQSGDENLPCTDLATNYDRNTATAATKIASNKAADKKDLVVGVLIWPGLADFNNAPGHEGNALLDRNVELLRLASTKGCETGGWPDQPKRY